jgi:pimeloyl-ACP methyl ester carboxylesterase
VWRRSYGGMVITGVAQQIAAKIHSLVYLDSFVPENGKSLFDYLRAEQSGQMRDDAAPSGEGYKITPIPAAAFAVNAQDAAWVDRCASSSRWRRFEQKLEVSARQVPKRVYMLASGWDPSPFQPFGARFKDDRGWRSSASPAGTTR